MSTNTIKFKNPILSPTVLKQGNRGSLHPSLNILDTIECLVVYDKRQKIIIVDYDYDLQTDKYRKSIFSTNVENIVSDIIEFKQGLDV